MSEQDVNEAMTRVYSKLYGHDFQGATYDQQAGWNNAVIAFDMHLRRELGLPPRAQATGHSPRDPDTGLPISGWGIDHDRSHPPGSPHD